MTTHDTLMALADEYAYLMARYSYVDNNKIVLQTEGPSPRAALSAALQEVLAERDKLAALLDETTLCGAAERDANTMNALRYQWLRDQLYCGDVDVGEAYLTMRTVGSCPTEEQFDAAIDEAMKGTPT